MTNHLIISAVIAVVGLGFLVWRWMHRGDMVGHRIHTWERPDHNQPIPYILVPEDEHRGVWSFDNGSFE